MELNSSICSEKNLCVDRVEGIEETVKCRDRAFAVPTLLVVAFKLGAEGWADSYKCSARFGCDNEKLLSQYPLRNRKAHTD